MDDAREPLGEVLSKALERQEQVTRSVTPAAPTTQVTVTLADLPQRPAQPPSLFALAESDDASRYIAARRRDAWR